MAGQQFYSEVNCLSWDDTKQFLHHFGRPWIFRGQADAQWTLAHSLERTACDWITAVSSVDLPLDHQTAEKFLLRLFQRRSRHYLSTSDQPTSEIEWLALMQHHGAPTRLLDWTRSPYIAAYFALENPREECAVWAINLEWLRCQSKHIPELKQLAVFLETGWECIDEYYHLLDNSMTRAVLPVEPFYFSDRLNIQQGLFLFPTDPSASFQDNLMVYSELDAVSLKENVVKLVLPLSLRREALMELDQMNINRATLFPGIDGFAQSLKTFILKHGDDDEIRKLMHK